MRFLSDENVDARLVPRLRRLGHDAATIASDHPTSLSDVDLLQLANSELRILITNDHDLGELVVAKRLPPSGVTLFRLDPLATLATTIDRLDAASSHDNGEPHRFLVATTDRIRIRQELLAPRLRSSYRTSGVPGTSGVTVTSPRRPIPRAMTAATRQSEPAARKASR